MPLLFNHCDEIASTAAAETTEAEKKYFEETIFDDIFIPEMARMSLRMPTLSINMVWSVPTNKFAVDNLGLPPTEAIASTAAGIT